MEAQIPLATSTAVNPSKDPAKFVFLSDPDHWRMELQQHFCDELHKSSIFMAIIQALEEEGWRLRASNSVTHTESDRDTTKLFFVRA